MPAFLLMRALELTLARAPHLSTLRDEGVFTSLFTLYLHGVYRKLFFFKAVTTEVEFTFGGSTMNIKKLSYDLTAFHMYPTPPTSSLILQAASVHAPS